MGRVGGIVRSFPLGICASSASRWELSGKRQASFGIGASAEDVKGKLQRRSVLHAAQLPSRGEPMSRRRHRSAAMTGRGHCMACWIRRSRPEMAEFGPESVEIEIPGPAPKFGQIRAKLGLSR